VYGNYKTINNQTWYDKYSMPLLGEIFNFMAKLTLWIYGLDITICLFPKGQNEDYMLGHWPKWEGLFVSMKVLTFWVE